MTTVKFHDAAEFVEELRKDSPLVERGRVRLTTAAAPAGEVDLPQLRRLTVVATALVSRTETLAYEPGRLIPVARDHIVRLDRYCGDIWGLDNETDKKALEQAGEVQKMIEAACQEMGLQVRAGVYEVA